MAPNVPPTRLAIIGSRGLPPDYGGVERALSEIAPRLSRRGFDVVVYGHARGTRGFSRSHYGSVLVIRVPRAVSRRGNALPSLFAALHALFITRPDVVLLMASGPSILAPMFRAAGIRVVTSIRALDSQRDKWGPVQRAVLRAGEWVANRLAHACTVNSLAMVRHFRKRGFDPIYIPNGAPGPPLPPPPLPTDAPVEAGRYILFAARLVPEKRCHVLLTAYGKLPSQARIPLVVAGGHSSSTEYRQHLDRLAKGLPIFFLGHIPETELASYLYHCAVFVLPSVVEGMSNSLLAAMAYGRCCVVSGIPENRDVIADNGLVFPPDDVSALADRLHTALRDSRLRATLGKAAAVHARDHFSWDRTADAFAAVLRGKKT